ncbi:MAG: isochorismatase family protein [Caulobacter sp.]|nr:isochorismatase family protein [Vitreoscilla sp.]
MATIRTGNQAVLLVVDFQVGVVATKWDVPRVAANIARVVEGARAAGVPVIWVQHEDADMPRGSADWQLVPELVPADGEFRVCKRYNSAFEDTPLEAELARLGATHVVLAGAATNWCIRAAAYATLERGYDLTLVKDAHTTSHIDRGDGTLVEARGIIDDLNMVVTWLEYPGRKSQAANAAEVAF